jgi:VCBS repeat-containing protein
MEAAVLLTVADIGLRVRDDAYSVAEDGVLTVPAAGVLANDSNLGGGPLSAALANGPGHGTVTLNADGSFTYRPAVSYNGPDSFTYGAGDGVASGAGQVTLTVTPVNDAPVVGAIPDQEVDEGQVVEFVASATDLEGDAFTWSLVNPPAGATIDPVTGRFRWIPGEAYGYGVHTVTVRASDGDAGTGTVRVTVHEIVEGTAGRDHITVAQAGGTVTVTVNGANQFAGAAPRLTVLGLDGNDLIILRGLTVPTRVDGGEGDDLVNALGVRSIGLTIAGGGGADMLFGGRVEDTIDGGAGDDRIFGGFGSDLLIGGAGDDNLSGEAGNDTLQGGPGDDTLSGGSGNDVLEGGDGNDSLAGGTGHDTLRGGAGADRLLGDAGNDVLIGGAGVDTLAGGAGTNTLIQDDLPGAPQPARRRQVAERMAAPRIDWSASAPAAVAAFPATSVVAFAVDVLPRLDASDLAPRIDWEAATV